MEILSEKMSSDSIKIPEEGHFFPIVNIQRFVGNNNKHSQHLCYNCLKTFIQVKH